MRSTAIGVAVVLGLAPAAYAQATMRYHTFQGRDSVVTCGEGTMAGRPARSIFTRSSSWSEQNLQPSDAVWRSSGCEGYIAHQSRWVSGEEVRDRLNSIANPPAPESYETIMGQIMSTVCDQNPAHKDCKQP